MDDNQFRIIVACRMVDLFRQSIELNGGRYIGHMVPNLTSITDVLTLPMETLREQVAKEPELAPADTPPSLVRVIQAGRANLGFVGR